MMLLEVWGKTDYRKKEVVLLDKASIRRTLEDMAKEWSATLTISLPPWELVIGASCGNFVVTAMSEDSFYDLIGNPTISGEIPFALGGQDGDYPSRLIVPIDRIVDHALFLIRTNSINIADPSWSVQN